MLIIQCDQGKVLEENDKITIAPNMCCKITKIVRHIQSSNTYYCEYDIYLRLAS